MMLKKPRILIVDDFSVNREILTELLKDEYTIIEAKNGYEALEQINQNLGNLSLILLDIMMPGLNGFEVLDILRTNGTLTDIPVILITASNNDEVEQKGFKMGAVDFVSKPFNPDTIRARIDTHVELKNYRDNLKEKIDIGDQRVNSLWDSLVDVLASLIEYRNVESGQHIARTEKLTDFLLTKVRKNKKYALTNADCYVIPKVATIHDVGKVAIAESILLKADKLTEEEFEVVKKHTEIGRRIASRLPAEENNLYIKYYKEICYSHHERWDGTGYPEGLQAEDIPFSARLTAIVDAYDALISDRVYRKTYTQEEAFEVLEEESGKHFDPELVKVFLANKEGIMELYQNYNTATK